MPAWAKAIPEVRIGQLLNALKRNVRYLSAIGLHAGGMTLAESQQMFAGAGAPRRR